MKLKEKLKEFGTKAKNFVAKNWKPIVLGTVTVGGVVYCILCKKKIKNSCICKKLDVKEFNVGEFVAAYEFDQYTEMATNRVPIKELGELGKEVLNKIPGATEDTLVCIDAFLMKNVCLEDK